MRVLCLVSVVFFGIVVVLAAPLSTRPVSGVDQDGFDVGASSPSGDLGVVCNSSTGNAAEHVTYDGETYSTASYS